MAKIFSGISDESLDRMCACFNAAKRFYRAGDTIMTYYNLNERVGIVLSGEAEVVKYDIDGNRLILERLTQDSVFGKLFTYLTEDGETSVICSKNCEVLFIDYSHLIKRCEKACEHHSIFVSNMLNILSDRTKEQSAKIDVLSQRTMRKKLMSYFVIESKRQGKKSFDLPFSLSNLADYLCVDRSAMLREMKKMRDEGFILSRAKHITLLKTEV